MLNWLFTLPKGIDSRGRNAFRAANIMLVSLIIFDIFSTPRYLVERTFQTLAGMILAYVSTIFFIIWSWLIRRSRVNVAVWGMIITSLIALLLSPLSGGGLGLIYGATAVLVTTMLAGQGLEERQITRANIIGIAFGISTYLLDVYLYPKISSRVSGGSSVTIITLFALLLAFGYITARQFTSYGIRAKLIILFLAVSIIPLSLFTFFNYVNGRARLIDNANEVLSGAASLTANQLDDYFTQNLNITLSEAQVPDIVDYLLQPANNRTGSLEEAHTQKFINALARQDTTYIISISIIDANGRVLVDTLSANVGSDKSDTDYFQSVLETDAPYASTVKFDPQTNTPSFFFASPVRAANGKVIGVLSKQFNASILQASIIKKANLAGSDSYAVLLDANHHLRLADGVNESIVFKTIIPLDAKVVAESQLKQLLPQGKPEDISTNLTDFESKLNLVKQQPFFASELQGDDPYLEQATTARMKTQEWIVVFAQPQESFVEPINLQTRNNVFATILISLFITGFGFLVSQYIAGPLAQLTKVAENISTGNFTQKAEINTQDEIGVLANTFNSMSSQIQELITSLEGRVEQRTTELERRSVELEQTTVQSEKRASELQTIAEVARYISTEKDLEKLLTLITQTVSERFGHYHTGIFLLNDNKKYAVLRAANSEGGQVMLNRQHKLEVGQVGIVGNVTFTGKPRIALDTGADAVYFNNPDLPLTRCELALPLTARGYIIGALDIQSTVPNAFTDSDISVLGLLADQIAIAIDNVRLLEESQNALNETQSVFREYLAESWQRKSASDILGYHQTLTGGQLVTGKAVNEFRDDANKDALAIPIRLRDQIIGTLNIRANNEGRVWSADEINIVQAVAERLGLALDNARLFEETSSRASRERLVSDISTKIRSTNNPQEMVNTAIEELKRALGATRIEIIPKPNKLPPDK